MIIYSCSGGISSWPGHENFKNWWSRIYPYWLYLWHYSTISLYTKSFYLSIYRCSCACVFNEHYKSWHTSTEGSIYHIREYFGKKIKRSDLVDRTNRCKQMIKKNSSKAQMYTEYIYFCLNVDCNRDCNNLTKCKR